MLDHVPMAGTPGWVSRDPPADLWYTRFPLWDLYFGLLAATVGVGVLISAPTPLPARLGSLALLAAIAVWYVAFGRRLMRYGIEDWRGYLYLAVTFALYVPSVALAPSASFALLVLCAQMFMLLHTVPAIGAVLLFNAVHVVLLYLRIGDGPDFRGVLLIAALTAVSVSVLGSWIRHMVVEGERRTALIRELNATRDEVARLSHQAGTIAERQRLAGEIHDTVAQGLSSVVMLIQAAEADLDRGTGLARRHLELAARTTRENLAEVRALVAALSPGELAGSPVAQALERLVDRFGSDTGVGATWAISGPVPALPTSVEVVLLRAAQESLANVRKHACAGSVSVRLRAGTDRVVLDVIDDGTGFDIDTATDGYGLGAMRSRVEQVGGAVQVRSAPGAGTAVRVEVPLP